MKKQLKKNEGLLQLDKSYKNFLTDIKEKLRTAQIRAALAANTELIKFYWELGRELIERQKAHAWGDHFLEQFSHDMRQGFPEMQGFSIRNLQRMRQFAQLYPDFLNAPQAVAQLPWGHVSLLISSVKDAQVREWYAQQTIKNGWSRSVLEMQVESKLYERQGSNLKLSNYNQHLPSAQSDLANEILKDPYNFDFLTVKGEANERTIENGLVADMRDFLLELGQGFAFVGSQVPLTFEDQEFFIDLLFYHLNLRCFVVIELKTTKFKPEHTGQLGFYLAVVDDLMRKEDDNPTIGILLCKSKNKIVAEYALRGIKVPIGISEFKLPTVEQIEAELNESRDDLRKMRGKIKFSVDLDDLRRDK